MWSISMLRIEKNKSISYDGESAPMKPKHDGQILIVDRIWIGGISWEL